MNQAVIFAFASAALFGVSTPAGKALLASVHPAVLAGLFYCGAGVGVALLRRVQARRKSPAADVSLGKHDLPWLAGAVFCGGLVGPLLLLIGLSYTQATTASLLLTFEGAATALLAWLLFREHYGARLVIGAGFLVAGAVVLAWSGTPTLDVAWGPLAIIGACIAWAIDNNLTRKVSLADPLQIVEIKGLVAGPINLVLGLLAGGAVPGLGIALAASAVGFVCYGLSLVLFILAMRDLGTARASAYYSTAPFIGALGAVIALREPLTVQLGVSGLLMGAGVWLHLTERHEHMHLHREIEHAHPHVHDAHHQHSHAPSVSADEPHTHTHRHRPMTHEHPHTPDMHHGHKH
ncbi:MAG: EamA family transporter [Xanthobacteraceae bacterium]|nr:EamA family transporter [Xanthobacteraceae bacterium]